VKCLFYLLSYTTYGFGLNSQEFGWPRTVKGDGGLRPPPVAGRPQGAPLQFDEESVRAACAWSGTANWQFAVR